VIPGLSEARRDLAAALEYPPLDGVDAVYEQESNREASGPCYLTVALEAVRPTEIVLAVRVYSQMVDGVGDATDTLEAALEGADDRLLALGLGPSDWQVGLDAEISCMVARCFVNQPRTSF